MRFLYCTIINKFLEAWERIKKIRKIRDDMAEVGIKGKAAEEISEQVTTIVEEIVEESTNFVFARYHGDAAGRRNELKTAIGQDVKRLYGQIERGLTVEFQAERNSRAPEDELEAVDNIRALSQHMKFPPASSEPLLLGTSEILEGEIQRKNTKKTTTTKTTITKAATKKGQLDSEESK